MYIYIYIYYTIYMHPGESEFCVFNYCAVFWCAQIIVYIKASLSYTHICTLHYLICRPIRRHWTAKMLIRSVFAIIFHEIHGALCVQLTHFTYDDCENTCIWFYYHHQIGSMTHLPLFRSWNNDMRCMSFYILIKYFTTECYLVSKIVLSVFTRCPHFNITSPKAMNLTYVLAMT